MKTKNNPIHFVTTAAAGLEDLVVCELESWGVAVVSAGPGAVEWWGTLEQGYRSCLWSRFASRVLLVISTGIAETPDALYEWAHAVPWEEHLGKDKTFSVGCTLGPMTPEAMSHSKYVALRVKDAIADRFRDRFGTRPDVRVSRPDLRIHVHIESERSLLAVDFSAESLHRRGYRVSGGDAPLKESLAAAIVELSGWKGQTALIDPCCGSGTLLIEAALMVGDSAPGLGRSYFGFVGWNGHDETLWQGLIDEAVDREERGCQRDWPVLKGYDADREMVRIARENVKKAGLDDRIEIQERALSSLSGDSSSTGWIICNPPYGERLSERNRLRFLYRQLGNRLRQHFEGWTLALFTALPEYADQLRFQWHASRRLYNGGLSCMLYIGVVPGPDPVFRWQIGDRSQTGGQNGDFSNRLRKNLQKALPWAAERGLECFRVYDRDLQEYNVRIELYRKWVLVEEYAASSSVRQAIAEERFRTVLAGVKNLLGVGRDRLWVSRRSRSERSAAAVSKAHRPRYFEVGEGGARFLVVANGGKFIRPPLDQRTLRNMIGAESRGKTFLNLTDDVGAASICAALNGARRTMTVVSHEEKREYVENGLMLNGMYEKNHRVAVAADRIRWLAGDEASYGVIFALFRSSGRPDRTGRKPDPVRLLKSIVARLERGGVAFVTVEGKAIPACIDAAAAVLPEGWSFHRLGRDSVTTDCIRMSGASDCLVIRNDQETPVCK